MGITQNAFVKALSGILDADQHCAIAQGNRQNASLSTNGMIDMRNRFMPFK